MDIMIILLGIGILAILVWIVATGKLKSSGPGGAALTSMHDFSPRDRQEAIEIIVEQKAGKRWEEQQSGEGKDDGERIGSTRNGEEGNEREQNESEQNHEPQ